ncbi:MAG: hypothetical protein AB9882_10050 [Ignavibacteriaceae bacterium]
MTRKKIIRLTIFGVIVTILIVFSYELICGKLFPFPPNIIGFTHRDLPHTSIYLQSETDYSDFKKTDTLIPVVEDLHKFKLKSFGILRNMWEVSEKRK